MYDPPVFSMLYLLKILFYHALLKAQITYIFLFPLPLIFFSNYTVRNTLFKVRLTLLATPHKYKYTHVHTHFKM